jgi:long-chain acyl-CoA synthetase
MIASGGPRNSVAGTLNQLFFQACEQYDKPDALQVKIDGAYRPISHRTLLERVRRTALGLQEIGVRSGDRIGLLSENRPEWAIADYACLSACVADVPIYPNSTPDQAAYILRDSGSVAIFVSTAEQAAKIAQIRRQVPTLRHVIGFDTQKGPGVDLTLAELEARGAAAETPERIAGYRKAADAVRPGDLATIIYTSGTTGDPKGVMLTHDNIFSNVRAARAVVPFAGEDICLSFLPLSHIFERMAGH